LWNVEQLLSGEQINERGPRAAIRHMHEVHPGHHLEQLAGHMGRAPIAGRPMLILPGLALA